MISNIRLIVGERRTSSEVASQDEWMRVVIQKLDDQTNADIDSLHCTQLTLLNQDLGRVAEPNSFESIRIIRGIETLLPKSYQRS